MPATIAQLGLKLGGANASALVMNNIREVIVDQTLHLPSMFTLRLYGLGAYLNDDTFKIGTAVEISAGYDVAGTTTLLKGKIVSIEPDLDAENPILVVRGLDQSHKLYRGRKTRIFTQITDSDLASQLANEVSLTPSVDATTEVYQSILQNNQTNAELLLERARRIGYEMFVDDTTLYFRALPASPEAVTLKFGDDILRFSARMSTADQVDQVDVIGWDITQKTALTGTATTGAGAPAIGETQTGSAMASSAWGAAKFAVAEYPVPSAGEATKRAQAYLDELASTFVEADITCRGNATLLAGKKVTISGVGTRFNGSYYVTQAIHRYSVEEGYVTQCTISGKRDRGVWSLLEEAHTPPKSTGLVIGLVTDNKDPNEMGRVKVKYPWLPKDPNGVEIVSDWARIAAPMAGNQRGQLWLPEVDDEVLVGFHHGDINNPFILGALWNGQDKLPLNQADAVGSDGLVNKRIFKTRAAHTVTFDDTADAENIIVQSKSTHTVTLDDKKDNEKITIKSKGGHTITIDDVSSAPKITIQSNGGHSITIDDTSSAPKITIQSKAGHSATLDDTSSAPKVNIQSKAGHVVTLDDTPGSEQIKIVDKTSSNQVIIKSSDNSISMKATGNINIEATGKIAIKGTGGVDVSTDAQLSLKGTGGATMSTDAQLKLSGTGGAQMTSNAQLKLSGTAGAELSSTAMTTVKGSMLQVQGSGPTTVKGNPVMIN